ncbi:MBG domain-containing protein [Pontibacter liquoris]|uniref:MBG domain-containing protein n=1 Tax=Pontibacter liquoris TaxID=2905677 RepID=UPI001FA6FE5D|nr:MBG domain-containing protein [Pontibacter liquoris]
MQSKLLLKLQAKEYHYFQRFLLVTGLFLLSSFGLQAQTVSSDKDDYAPGEIAFITGSGWTLDQTVHVEFKEEPDYPDYHVYDVAVDAAGNWQIEYPIESRHIGVKFTVTATGKQSTYTTQTVFTDANVEFKSTGLPNGTNITVRYRIGTSNSGPQSSLTFSAPGPSNSLAVTELQTIYYSFDNVTLNGVIYTASGGSQTGTKNNGKISLSADFISSCTGPAITTQPVNQTVTYGANAAFTVAASGTATLAYQWQVDSGAGFGNISGATSATLNLTQPAVSLNGNQYRCVVTNSCGTATTNAVSITVNKATATVTLSNLQHIYDGSAKFASASTDVTGTSSFTYTYDGSSAAPVNYKEGGYIVVATLVNDNYSGSTSGTLIINKAATTTLVTLATGPFTYTGSPITPASVSVTGPGLSLTPAATYASNTNAGTATASYSYAGSDNYLASSDSKTFSIGKAAATIVVTGKTVTYDGKAHGASGTAKGVNNEDLTGLNLGSSFTNVPGGTASWTFTNANYVDQSGQVDIIINKAPVTLTLGNLEHTYDGTLKSATATATPAVSGISISNNGKTYAGTYEVEATLDNANYSAAVVTGNLVIAQKALSVTANDKERKYNQANPVFDGVVEGAVAADNISADYSTIATQTSNVGEYAINVTLVDPNNKLGNYSVTKTPGILKITPASATISLTDLAKTYNGSAQGATVTTSPAGLAVNVTYAGSATIPTNAGTYAVVASLNNSNYTASNGTGSLVIAKAPTTTVVTLASGPFTYTGSAITPATVRVTGPGLSLTPKAEYADNVNAGTATAGFDYVGDDNYLASSDSKTFQIGKANATIAVNGYTGTYDGVAHGATGSATGVKGETLAGLALGNTFTNAPGGTASWIFTDATGNYNNTSGSTAVVINKKELTVTAENQSKYCGQANPSFTVSYSGFVLNENASVLTTAPVASANTSQMSGTGTYTITAAGGVANNYSFKYVDGTLTINSVAIDAAASGTPVAINTTATLSAIVSPAVQGVTVQFTLDNGTSKTAVTGIDGIATVTVTGLTVGVYQVKASVGSDCASSTAYLPVYDPNSGFVTGGGWINSPAGAYVAEPSATGKANFGFVAKYKKGSTAVEGETEFQFQAGNLNFKSTSYETATLVISGAKASYRGVGTINGTGTYKFTLSAIDGQLNGGGGTDKIRMKIVDSNGNTVYDNQSGAADNADAVTALGGGSIVIHEANVKTSTASKLVAEAPVKAVPTTEFYNYPNAFSDRTTIAFSVEKEQSYALEVFDVRGVLVKKVAVGVAEKGKLYEYEVDAHSMAEGIYFARLSTTAGVQTIKMLLKK